MDKGYNIGLLDEALYRNFLKKKQLIQEELQRLKETRIKYGDPAKSETLEQLLKRPEIAYGFIEEHSPSDSNLTPEIKKQVEIQIKYEGYIQQQMQMAEKLKKIEGKKIPSGFDYSSVNGLSREVLGKLQEVRPENLGQASRIPGITPTAISLLMVAIERLKRSRENKSTS